jgi:hypothetical protein
MPYSGNGTLSETAANISQKRMKYLGLTKIQATRNSADSMPMESSWKPNIRDAITKPTMSGKRIPAILFVLLPINAGGTK